MFVYYSGWAFLGGAKCVSIPLREEDAKTYAMDGWCIGYLITPLDIINGAIKMH